MEYEYDKYWLNRMYEAYIPKAITFEIVFYNEKQSQIEIFYDTISITSTELGDFFSEIEKICAVWERSGSKALKVRFIKGYWNDKNDSELREFTLLANNTLIIPLE